MAGKAGRGGNVSGRMHLPGVLRIRQPSTDSLSFLIIHVDSLARAKTSGIFATANQSHLPGELSRRAAHQLRTGFHARYGYKRVAAVEASRI
jgi:hypothetical protein